MQKTATSLVSEDALIRNVAERVKIKLREHMHKGIQFAFLTYNYTDGSNIERSYRGIIPIGLDFRKAGLGQHGDALIRMESLQWTRHFINKTNMNLEQWKIIEAAEQTVATDLSLDTISSPIL
jgi:hypothetical protein